MSENDRRMAAMTEEALTGMFEDIFTDSKFLKQGEESGRRSGGSSRVRGAGVEVEE